MKKNKHIVSVNFKVHLSVVPGGFSSDLYHVLVCDMKKLVSFLINLPLKWNILHQHYVNRWLKHHWGGQPPQLFFQFINFISNYLIVTHSHFYQALIIDQFWSKYWLIWITTSIYVTFIPCFATCGHSWKCHTLTLSYTDDVTH